MPITEFLTRNAQEQPDDVALVELAPHLMEKAKMTWREYPLIQ